MVIYIVCRVCELWCGESNGNISIFTMNENSVVAHDVINHFETPMPNVEVMQMISSHSPVQYDTRHPAVWSYIYPGMPTRNLSATKLKQKQYWRASSRKQIRSVK